MTFWQFVSLWLGLAVGVLVLALIGALFVSRRPKHHHTWVEEGRRFVKPTQPDSLKTEDRHLLRGTVFGMTFIRLRCSECGQPGTREFVGDHTKKTQ